jgi:hypothetical protein
MSIAPNVDRSPYFDATVADGVESFAIYNHMYLPTVFDDPDAEYDRLINDAGPLQMSRETARGPE